MLHDVLLVPWHVISDFDTFVNALQACKVLLNDVWDVHTPWKCKLLHTVDKL